MSRVSRGGVHRHNTNSTNPPFSLQIISPALTVMTLVNFATNDTSFPITVPYGDAVSDGAMVIEAGVTTVRVAAPGMINVEVWTHSSKRLSLTSIGGGNFTGTVDLSAEFNGPLTFDVYAYDGAAGASFTHKCKQRIILFITGGTDYAKPVIPLGAFGMTKMFEDNFTSLSVSSTDTSQTWYPYQPVSTGGQQFGDAIFIDPGAIAAGGENPFTILDSYLRIRCKSQPGVFDSNGWGRTWTTGMLALGRPAGVGGTYFTPPFYMECRYMSAIGVTPWASFWLNSLIGLSGSTEGIEIDVTENLGNFPAYFRSGIIVYNPAPAPAVGYQWPGTVQPGSGLFTKIEPGGAVDSACFDFHTYGLIVTATTTTLYVDNNLIGEMAMPTLADNATTAYFCMIDNALGGGGWGEVVPPAGYYDLWVDYVNVWQGTPEPEPLTIASISPTSGAAGAVITIVGTGFAGIQGTSTIMLSTLELTVQAWSDSQIVAVLPSGLAVGTAVPIVITLSTGTVSSSTFTVAMGHSVQLTAPALTVPAVHNFFTDTDSNAVLYGDDITDAAMVVIASTNVVITVTAPGMLNVQAWTHNTLACQLTNNGGGSFSGVLNLSAELNGPLTLDIYGYDTVAPSTTYANLSKQRVHLFVTGGTDYIKPTIPAGATGMTLQFEDDFNGPLSVSSTDITATWFPAQPVFGGGQQFGDAIFQDPAVATGGNHGENPFTILNSYLRIRCKYEPGVIDPQNFGRSWTTGMLALGKPNGIGGQYFAPPFYMECRFLSAIGETPWEAFWLNSLIGLTGGGEGIEIDVAENLGYFPSYFRSGVIVYNPAPATLVGYQFPGEPNGAGLFSPVGSGVADTNCFDFHTYGVQVTATTAAIYVDNTFIGSMTMPTLADNATTAYFCMIDNALGSGWPVTPTPAGYYDMWVDYVSIWQGTVIPETLTITSITPTSGIGLSAVVIAGTGFGFTQKTGTIKMGTVAMTVNSWIDTAIHAVVPAGFAVGAAIGITLVVGAQTATSALYTITGLETLTVTGISPLTGPVGQTVTITGAGFGPTQGSNLVYAGVVGLPIVSWSDTIIVGTVPSAAGSAFQIGVVVNGVFVPFATNFVVSGTGVAITSVAPTNGVASTSVTITGTGFGTTQGSSTLTLESLVMGMTSWSATSVVATVPAGVSVGATTILLTVGGVSGTTAFTVISPTSLAITSLSPGSGIASSTITITGTGFGATQGGSTLTMETLAMGVTSWSATSIVATVPSAATTGSTAVSLTVSSVNVTSAFTVTSTSGTGFPASIKLVIAGDSIGAGAIDGVDPWVTLSFSPATYSYDNQSVSGEYLDQFYYPNNAVLEAGYTAANGPLGCWLVIQAGTNDLAAGALATYMYNTDVSNIISLWRAAGAGKVAIATVLPRFDGHALTTGQQTEWNSYNTLVRANSLGADAVVDIAAITAMQITGAYIDGLHPTGVAYAANVAPVYNSTILNYIIAAAGGTGSSLTITSVSPSFGLASSTVTISGAAFGTTQGSSTLLMEALNMGITSWANASIVATVPAGAINGVTSAVLTVGGVTVSTAFTVGTTETLTVTNITPLSGPVGQAITITGTGFGTTQGSSIVYSGIVGMPIYTWSDTSIFCEVPVGTGLTVGSVFAIGVYVNGVFVGYGPTFTVTS